MLQKVDYIHLLGFLGLAVPSAFVLCQLKFHQSKHGVEAKLDQSEVPTKGLESLYRKYQLLSGGESQIRT